MVKFLFAKEKMRVRFPLSAQDNVLMYLIYNLKRFNRIKDLSRVDHDSLSVLSSSFFSSHPKIKIKR